MCSAWPARIGDEGAAVFEVLPGSRGYVWRTYILSREVSQPEPFTRGTSKRGHGVHLDPIHSNHLTLDEVPPTRDRHDADSQNFNEDDAWQQGRISDEILIDQLGGVDGAEFSMLAGMLAGGAHQTSCANLRTPDARNRVMTDKTKL